MRIELELFCLKKRLLRRDKCFKYWSSYSCDAEQEVTDFKDISVMGPELRPLPAVFLAILLFPLPI